MAQRITVTDTDIEVGPDRYGFTTVTVLGTYTLARIGPAHAALYAEICGKCEGSGYLAYHSNVAGGVCFPCTGSGLLATVGKGTALDVVRVLRRREKDAARRKAKRAAQETAKRDTQQAWLAANPQAATVSAYVRAAMDRDGGNTTAFSGVLQELACKANNWPLTAAQIELLLDLTVKEFEAGLAKADRAATRQWLGTPGAKVTAAGRLVYTRTASNTFGWQERISTLFVIETGDGDTVKWWWNGYYEPARGTVYTVTGSVKEHGQTEEYGKFTQLTRVKAAPVA